MHPFFIATKHVGILSNWLSDVSFLPGQNIHWRSGHRKICKLYSAYTSFQLLDLDEHKKMDAILLSNLVAHISSVDTDERTETSPLPTFQSLLSGPAQVTAPPICLKHAYSQRFLDGLYSRFENNNFTIHSHFKTYAHGIFPLASRLFNHSCMPNAAAKFVIRANERVKMEIIALRTIAKGDEVRSRRKALSVLTFVRSVFRT